MQILKNVACYKFNLKSFIILNLLTFSILPFSILWAMGEQTSIQTEQWDKEKKVEQALEALRRAYSDKDLSSFFHGVSEDYYPGWADLRADLSSRFSHVGLADLYFVVNQNLIEGNKAALQVRWQKRMANEQTGQIQKTEGSAEFIFQITPEGKPQLIDIRGQSPF